MATDKPKGNLENLIDVHSKALDDLVNVNSLFTVAVFIGLSFASPNQRSLESKSGCDPDPQLAKEVVMYEVAAFACFLVSSLAAKSLKVLLNFYKIRDSIELRAILRDKWTEPSECYVLSHAWRHILLAVSAVASACGIFFLTFSLVIVVQIRLGKLSCGSEYTLRTVTFLSVMVALSLLTLYLPPVFFAIVTTPKKDTTTPEEDTATTAGKEAAKDEENTV